jgi:hypothetical protein
MGAIRKVLGMYSQMKVQAAQKKYVKEIESAGREMDTGLASSFIASLDEFDREWLRKIHVDYADRSQAHYGGKHDKV